MGVLHFDRHAEQVYVDDVNITEVTTTAIHPAEGIYKNGDCEDKQQLLDETKAELKRRSTPTVSYEADVLTLTKAGMDTAGVALGDRVLLVDTTFTPDLRLAGRVLQLEEDLLDPALTVITIGNIIERFTASSRSAEQRLDRVIAGTLEQKSSSWDNAGTTLAAKQPVWDATAATVNAKAKTWDDAATITANHAQVIQQSTIGVTFHYEDLAITLGDAISLTDASGTWTFKDGAFVKQEPEPTE